MTPEEIETEYWTYHYFKHGIKEDFEDERFDELAEKLENGELNDDEWDNLINTNSEYTHDHSHPDWARC